MTSASIAAPLNPLIECLGKEELKLHKSKKTGPVYKLNQLFLNDLVSAGDISLKEKYFKRVCINPKFTPSVDLMREILISDDIFILSKEVINVSIRNFQLSTIEEIKRVIPHIFFSYLSSLQAQTATPNCLTKYIPELKYFQDQFKYLESELETSPLLNEKKKILNIFDALTRFPEIKRKCILDKKRQEKEKK